MSKIANEFMNEWPDYDWGTAEDVSEYMLNKVLDIVDTYISANSENDNTVEMLYHMRAKLEDLI